VRHLLVVGALVAPAAAAWAEEPKPKLQRIVEFAPNKLYPGYHDCERAGTCSGMAKHAQPSITKHYGLGYVGGSSLLRGGPRSTYDTLNVAGTAGSYGTFGTDYVLFGKRPGRIFLGFFDKPHAKPLTDRYLTDKKELPDPFVAPPFKTAVKEAILEHREGGHGEKEKEKKEGGGH
jgi:hypothetical protein